MVRLRESRCRTRHLCPTCRQSLPDPSPTDGASRIVGEADGGNGASDSLDDILMMLIDVGILSSAALAR